VLNYARSFLAPGTVERIEVRGISFKGLFIPHPDLLPSRGEGTLMTTIVSAKSRGCPTDNFKCHRP
jgi:hypothetical protein